MSSKKMINRKMPDKKISYKKLLYGLLICVFLILVTACSLKKNTNESGKDVLNNGSSIENSLQVQYHANEITLPWTGEEEIQDLCRMQDGSLAVISKKGSMCVSSDGGITWANQTNESLKTWYNNIINQQEISIYDSKIRLSTDGQIIAYIQYSYFDLKNSQTSSENNPRFISYWYEKSEEIPIQFQYELEKDDYFHAIWFSEDGKLFTAFNDSVYEMNPQNGEKEFLFQGQYLNYAYSIGDTILAVDNTILLYDYKSKKIMDSDNVLEDFIKQMRVNNYIVIISKGEENSVYILCNNGLYRHILGGSSIEQLIEGVDFNDYYVDTTVGSRILNPKEGEFLLPTSQGNLISYSYGVAEVAKPQVTLTIYNLMSEMRDSQWPTYFNSFEMALAIKKYKKLRPEVEIVYNVGISPHVENTVPVGDVIKQVNLDIAAGNGADIYVLDYLPVDTYIKKGILADISDVVRNVDKKEGILDVVKENFTNEDGNIYHFPIGFTLNMIYGPLEFIEKATDLPSLVQAMEEQEQRNKEMDTPWYLDLEPEPNGFIQTFAQTSMGAWLNEKGEINEDKLLEFFTLTNKVYHSVITDTYPKFQSAKAQLPKFNTLEAWIHRYYNLADINKVLTYARFHGIKECETRYMFMDRGDGTSARGISLGELGNAMGFYKIIQIYEKYRKTTGFGTFYGQSKNVYNAKRMLGVNANSQNQKEAKEFIEFLLSFEADYGANTMSQADKDNAENFLFSVNKKRLEYDLNRLYGNYRYVFSSKMNVALIREILESLEEPAVNNRTLFNIVADAGAKILWGDYTPEQGVKEVKEKMEIYLME